LDKFRCADNEPSKIRQPVIQVIKIIDYGLGNVKAFLNAFKLLGINCDSAKVPEDINGASHLILPGVGSFDLAMKLFINSGMREVVEKTVLSSKIPILGICVGMQIMASSSDEGIKSGLNWIPGKVKKIKPTFDRKILQIPHMGWNDIAINKPNPILKSLNAPAEFYFLHSYYFLPSNENDILANFIYGENMPCAVGRDNIFGVQFHPEKSHDNGLKLLKNFSQV